MPMATGVTKSPYFGRLATNAQPQAQPSPPPSPTSRLAQVSGGSDVAPINLNREGWSVPAHTIIAGDNGSAESIPNIAVMTPKGVSYAAGNGIGA